MKPTARITVRVEPFVKEELQRLKLEVAEILVSRPPSQDDIVAALIHAAESAVTAEALRAYYVAARPWE